MTSTSRLSSLLVRDGLVRVGRMEHVFQRQVIYGGSLDTILLEMKLVEDHRLQRYLSLATGLPPANGALSSEPSADLTKTCTHTVATKYQVVPISLQEGSLGVLVSDPVDVSRLEGLADELDISVQPMVVPEYQYRMTFARLYGEETEERFAKLAEQASTNTVPTTAKQVPIVTIGERAAVDKDIDDEPGDGQAIPQAIEPESTQPADTSERVRGKRPPAEEPPRRQTQELNTDSLREQVAATDALAKDAPKVVYDTPLPAMKTSTESGAADKTEPHTRAAEPEAADSDRPTVVMAAQDAPDAEAQADADQEANPFASITPDQARSLLDKSEDRDEIFTILLRAIRKRARHASLFTVKGKTAIGRVALTKAGIDREAIKEISINLEAPSRFHQVLTTKAFSVGTLSSNDADVTAAMEALGGGEVPASALLLPVVMRDRLIAIAVGHNSERGISVSRVTELLPLGTATAEAVSRLLAKMRAAKAQDSGATKAPAASAPGAESKAPVAASKAPEDSSNAVPVADEAMVELFSRIESDSTSICEAAMKEAIQQSDKVISHLYFGFPGKLLKTRDESSERMRAADHGPVLDLITQIGPKCGPALSQKMRDADREVRYYATLCAAELRPSDVLNEIIERLFDGDEKIRNLAVEALSGYPKDALDSGLEFARRALHSEDNARVKLAAEGLTKLEDTSAISDLIDAHSRGGDAAEVSRAALLTLTNQDFGNSTRKWRAWWEKNQGGNRIEWMLEGLAHKNAEIRKNSSETLRRMTGEFFGYGHDLPKKERDKKRKLWMSWWDQSGKERFL